ncbi:MAG: pglI [Solirubrobacterales bacterium]|nr:pglI [Solirubrobacterales bacterium]
MKISVLLPTRDRLELVRHAVASVRRIDDPDWEIVISDNCSSGDVEGYVASLDDERIRYLRTPEVLSVTENWNNALDGSTGEYVVMLGDDDALLSGYFTRTRRLIADFDHPQVIYHNAISYAYPGVIPAEPDGFLRAEGYADFLRDCGELPFRLPVEDARRLARAAANFRLGYGLNMQFVTVARSTIDDLSGGGSFFRSPFPDYYAMNHLFARACSIVVEPHPLVVIGVSPRSYGFFYNNNREAEGKTFLKGDDRPEPYTPGQSTLLPGTNINNGWLRAVEELHRDLGCPPDLRPNYRRYRMLQIIHVYNGSYVRGDVSPAQLSAIKRHLSGRERIRYGLFFSALAAVRRCLPGALQPQVERLATLISRQFPWWTPVHDPGHYGNIEEVVERVNGDRGPLSWREQRGSRLGNALLGRIFP